jgi:signal transduction histidine kinase
LLKFDSERHPEMIPEPCEAASAARTGQGRTGARVMGGDRNRPIDALLRAASMLRPLSSEGQLAELVRATLQDVPGVAHVDVRLDAGEPDNARSDGAHRVQDLASGGCIFGAVRIRVGDPRAFDANEAVIRHFIDLVGQEIEFRRTQRELREANVNLEHAVTRFADFAHAASDWFWETDATGRYIHMSSGVNRIGAEPHDVIGKTRAEARRALGIVPIGVGQQELDAKEARREAYRDHAIRFRDATGNERTLELSACPVIDAQGVFRGYRGCGRDATTAERTNAELRRALLAEREMNAQQRRFVAVASHEFRTPLAIIDGASQRLEAKLGEVPPEIADKLARIRASVQRMSHMIDRTLHSARLDEGRLELRPSRCELIGLIRTAIEQQRAIAPGFDFAFAPPMTIATIVGDARLLEHVFINLLSNAVKFSGASNRVEITLASEPGGFVVAVRDFGIGILAEEIDKLFTRFYRTRAATGIAGTGLGLHLCKELVAMHGGALRVESRPGKGSTFHVEIPITPAAPMRAGSA